jgi:hypothetical protein
MLSPSQLTSAAAAHPPGNTCCPNTLEPQSKQCSTPEEAQAGEAPGGAGGLLALLVSLEDAVDSAARAQCLA